MKKTTKKLFTVICSIAATACFSLGGAFAFSQTTNVQADAASLETEFTNNGQFVVSHYNGITDYKYTFVDGGAEGLPTGYNGAVAKVTSKVASGAPYINIDFTASKIAVAGVESVVARVYSPDYTADDLLRINNITGSMPAADLSTWRDVALPLELITGEDGNLGTFAFGLRDKGTVSDYFYIDSITVNMLGTTEVTFSNIHELWNNYSYDNAHCTFLQFNGGISRNGDLDADFSNLLSKMTINGEAVDNGNISFYCPNWIGADGGIIMRVATNPEVGAIMELPAGAIFDIGGTDTNIYKIARDIRLQFNGSAWEVYVGTNYNPDFISIGEVNHVYSEGLNAYGVSLTYATTGFEIDGQHTASSSSGFSLNGEDIGVALWGGNQVLLWLEADKCVDDYKGYSHPTVVIKEGAKVTNTVGEEFTLGGVTLYLVDGAWTTTEPDGYHVEMPNASFVDFDVERVGATHNHFYNGTFYQLTLDFDQSGLAFNQHASAVSGITFNGMPMTCGGSPSGDSIMVITLNSGLWIHYTAEQATTGYKGYSHPTIHFENGATVTDANGKTMTYAELTLYLVDGAWTTEQPADYEITEPAKDTTFVALGKTEETNNANTVTLYFNDENEWTEDVGTLAEKVLLGGVALNSIGGSVTKGERSLTITWTGEYTTLTILENATFAGQNIPQMALYLNDGEWSFIDNSKEPTVSCVGPASGAWDNVELEEGYSTNVFKFSEIFAESNDKTNQAASISYSVAMGMKINGVTFYEMYLQDQNTKIDYDHGDKYLQFVFPKAYLEVADGEYPILTIEKGTTFMNHVLPACRYILYAGHWINAESFDPTPLPYNGIALGWNNSIFSGISNSILQFGEYGLDFLGPDNGTASHADPTNLANPALKAPISTALTIDGKAIGDLYEQDNNVQVGYMHGYNYFYIAIPEYMLSKDGYGCVTLHIEGGTVFMGCVLSEVTLYFYEGEWTSIKPDVIESEDTEYTTITQMFGKETKALSGTVSAESTLTANDSVIYSFLLKNDNIENTVMFSTHYTTDFDGIKVIFMGDAATESERVILFVNGQEIASASYLWTANEWFAIRIAVDVEETFSVSVAIDGVYLIKTTDLSKDALGTKIGVQNEKGNNTICDYKAGDIKKPVIYWQGKDVYHYEMNADKPSDSVFQTVIDIMDNKDGVIDERTLQVAWEEGAVTDGKLNEGTWGVTLSVSDAADNIAQHTITVVVEDTDKVTVTFDGVATDTVYHIGDLLAEPEAPVQEGYSFEGWYVGDVKWDFVNDVIAGDLALTSKFIKVETTYTVVITSEGLEENYVYTFELAYGATLDQTILIRDGYIYKLYVGEAEVERITVEGDANYKVVYAEVQDEPITPPDSSDSTNSGGDSVSDSQSGSNVVEGGCNGCSGIVSFGGIGLTLLLSSAVIMIKKRKED